MVHQNMVLAATQNVAMSLFSVPRTSWFCANATGRPIEIMIPDSLTAAVQIHQSSEYEKWGSLYIKDN